MYKRLILTVTVLMAMAVMFGCSDRGTGVNTTDFEIRNGFQSSYTQGGGHELAYQLGHSMFPAVHQSPKLDYRIYAPPGYDEGNLDKPPLPVLYLLAPFRGNAFYYFNRGLSVVADKLIAEGEIDPMFIVCIDGSSGYGGTFYGNTYAGGKYAEGIGRVLGSENMVVGSLVDWIDGSYPTLNERRDRGISGFEMGGYGAVRIAIEYSENFGSVSAVSSPLDFDGTNGNGGFIPLFQQVINTLDVPFRQMDTSYIDPLRTMIMAAGCSFSPHMWYDTLFFIQLLTPAAFDTVYFDDTLTLFAPEGSQSGIAFHLPFNENGDIPDAPFETTDYDSMLVEDISVDFIDTTFLDDVDTLLIEDSTITVDTIWVGPPVSDWQYDTTITYDTTIVYDSLFQYDTTFLYDTLLVVDTTIDTIGYYDSVWTLWLNNNPENLLAQYPNALHPDSTGLKLFTIADDEYGFNQQTEAFAAFLEATYGVQFEVNDFDGYEGYANTTGRFVYDILPYVLKFHSDLFRQNQE